MNFHGFLERVFCFMGLFVSLYYIKVHARNLNERKRNETENSLMTLEDYRIPLFVEDNGIILALGENIMIPQEYIGHIENHYNNMKWAWVWICASVLAWFQYIE